MNDSHKNDLLDDIWQTQKTHEIDIKEVVKLAKNQQRKQRVYIALDILSLSPFALLFIIDIQLSMPMYIFIACVFMSGLTMVGYFIKLRWYAAFGDISNTANFTQTLLKQYKNNALIAKINKHTGWMIATATIVITSVMQLFSDDELSVSVKKLAVVSAAMLAFGIPWCIWAHNRQKRFEVNIAQITSMVD
ncbi:MAG: hypothetical protein WA981_16050 [Glaciecola sp.]